jgi:Leucine-rich repeat (LRR) protein
MSSTSNLNLWKQQLEQIPDSVWQQTEIETLVLADNHLSELSGLIGRLKMLRMLDLGHNQLAQLPDEIGDLPNLTDFLYLHDNRLSSLPSSFGNLTRLRYLNASENVFEATPECVCRMSSLLELRLSDNALQSLPPSIGNLARLRELHLRNNKLTSLPDSVGMMKELRQIDLRGNPLTQLPSTIATFLDSKNWICGGSPHLNFLPGRKTSKPEAALFTFEPLSSHALLSTERKVSSQAQNC